MKGNNVVVDEGALVFITLPSLDGLEVEFDRKVDGAKRTTTKIELTSSKFRSWANRWRNRVRRAAIGRGISVFDGVVYTGAHSGPDAIRSAIDDALNGKAYRDGRSFEDDRNAFVLGLNAEIDRVVSAQTDPEVVKAIEQCRPNPQKYAGVEFTIWSIPCAQAQVLMGKEVFSAESLLGKLAQDIAQDIRDTWDPDSKAATQSIRNVLSRITSKCAAMRFIDPEVALIGQKIDEIVGLLPHEGLIDGPHYFVLRSLLEVLSDAKRIASGQLAKIVGAVPEPVPVVVVPAETAVATPVVPSGVAAPAAPAAAPSRNAWAW